MRRMVLPAEFLAAAQIPASIAEALRIYPRALHRVGKLDTAKGLAESYTPKPVARSTSEAL